MRYIDRGTSVLPFRGIGPTGRSYELIAMEWFVIRDGRIHRRWGARDFAAQSRQLGFRRSSAVNGVLLACLGVLLSASTAFGAHECPCSAVWKAAIPGSPNIVVVAEGRFEPRSVGSYSLRVYAGTNPRFPYDDFVGGAVRPRDGTVEDVRFTDLDRDGFPEIIVVMRSAGTGGYLSADAFRFRASALTLLGSVSGLPKNADPIRALETGLTNRAEPESEKPRR